MSDMETILEALKEAIINGKRKDAIELTKKALDSGIKPADIVSNYMIPALDVVGKRFETKKIFVPEMMISARAMQACLDLIKPLLAKDEARKMGTVVIGTVFGDLHDIGKNLVIMMLESAGFDVVNIGENVPPERFVEEARKHNADIVGLSSLLTTGDPYVKATIEAVKNSDIAGKVKVICGGAAVTPKFVYTCGADAYAPDAASAVSRVKELLRIGIN